MQDLPRDNEPIILPERINYDSPMEFINLFASEDGTVIVGIRKLINWVDIQSIEEYPDEFDDEWKQYSETPKTMITFHNGKYITVAAKYDQLSPLFIYYHKNIRKVENYQEPHYIKNRKR